MRKICAGRQARDFQLALQTCTYGKQKPVRFALTGEGHHALFEKTLRVVV